jgi:hypothetical protein
VVTSWSDSRILWPRCRALHQRGGGGSGLLMTEELASAVRCESALALQHWFGFGEHAVWNWRKALGVGMWEPEGSRRLHQRLSEKGAAALHFHGLSDEECDRRTERSRQLNLVRHLWSRRGGAPFWTAEELALLGTMADDELASLLGRPANGVRLKQTRLGIPNPLDKRRSEYHRRSPPAR